MATSWLNAWDRPRVDLGELADQVAEGGIEPLERVLRNVPSGLIHARSVRLVRARPDGFRPLAPDSRWSASGRSLAAACAWSPDEPLRALGGFAWWAQHVRLRVGPDHALAASLREGRINAQDRLELQIRLDLEPTQMAALERGNAFLDLGWMATQAFEPDVRVEAALRPNAAYRRGELLGENLARELSLDPAPLFVSDQLLPLDLVSPYCRDLGHALHAWGLENADRLRPRGLARALREARSAPEAALSAVVSQELLATEKDPELLAERRVAERQQGLLLRDVDGAVAGHARLERLAAPDPALHGLAGPLMLLAGGPSFGLEGAVAALLASGRIERLAFVSGLSTPGFLPTVPRAVVTSGDGYALPGWQALSEYAQATRTAVSEVDLVELETPGKPGAWVARSLGRVRRELVRGRLPAALAVFAVFYPSDPSNSSPELDALLTQWSAARLGLSTLCVNAKNLGRDPTVGVFGGANRLSTQRFRA